MAVPNNKSDDALLKNLVPLNTLSEEQLGQLLTRIVIEKARKGAYLFREGDSDHQNIYLLAGTVALLSGHKEMDLVSSGTQTARFALAHQLPRKHSARAKSGVTYVRIDSRMLSDMLARSQKASYEVDEAESAEKSDWMSLLLRSPVFQQIPPANLQRVMMRMKQVTVSADETIIKQGDEGDYFYLISSGVCRVSRQPEVDRPPVELAQLKAGQGFGEEALISDTPRSSTVTMITDGELVRLSKQDFVELVKQPLSRTIDYPDACKMTEEDALWVDVRPPEDYDAGHLPNAINLPFFSLRFQASSLASDRVYMIYGAEVGQSATAAYLLVERGYEVYMLSEGWSELAIHAGLQTQEAEIQADNVIDFNRDAEPSEDSESLQSVAKDEKSANVVKELQKQLVVTQSKFEEKLTQYQTEQKLLKQALSVAKRKLEIHEKDAETARQAHSEEVEKLQVALAEREALQQDSNGTHQDSERLLNQQVADLEKKLAQLQTKLKKSGAESQKIEEEKSQLEAKLEQELEESQAASAARDQVAADEIAAIKRELDTSQSELKQFEADKEALDEESTRLQAEIDELHAKAAQQAGQANSERNSLEQQIQKLNEQSTTLEQQRAGLEQELEGLRQARGDADVQHQSLLNSLRAELDQATSSISDLNQSHQQELAARDTAESSFKSALSEATEHVERLEADLKTAHDALESTESDLVQQMADLEAQLRTEQESSGQEKLHLQQAESDNQGLSEKQAELEQQLVHEQSAVESLRQEYADITGQLESTQKEYAELQQKTLETDAENQQSQNALQERLENAETEAVANSEALNETRLELKKLEEQRINLSARLEEEQRNAGFLKRSLATAEDAIEISENEFDEQGEAVDELKSTKLDLERSLSEIQDNLNKKEKQALESEQVLRETLEKQNTELLAVRSELEKAKAEEIEREAGRKIELEVVQAEKSELELELAESQNRLQDKIKEFDLSSNHQQQNTQQLERELSAAKSELVQMAGARDESQGSAQALQAAQQEIARLNKNIDGLREVQLEMETQFSDDSDEEIVKLRAALELEEKKRRRAEELAKQTDVLRREREVQETAVEMLGEDLDALELEKKALEEDKKVLERRLTELRGQFSELMDENNHLHTEVSEFRGQVDDSQMADDLLVQLNEMRAKVEMIEQERDEARSISDRMKQEVNELRSVIQTYVEQIKDAQSYGGNADLTALRSELDMVRHQASADLEQMRGELTAAKAKQKTLGGRDINEAASLQAQRQDMDSIRQALHEKEHMLRLSQTQCRTLEDSVEDRDREVDQLKRKLELLIRKTGGLGEYSETINAERATSHSEPFADTERDSDFIGESRTHRQSATGNDPKGSKLGRLFRKK
ncbi:MAG: cyclic nucleotide-binding domain-containing protein [Pseudomonadota bacterium]